MSPSSYSILPSGMLAKRAELLKNIRSFYDDREVMEVDVPALGISTVTDPYIQSFSCSNSDVNNDPGFFLQTSPEFYMKRLLSQGAGDMYYLGKAYRKEESGAKHSPEFTMLEWYRLGFCDRVLIEEVFELISSLKADVKPTRASYRCVFEQVVGVNPYDCPIEELQRIAKETLNIEWQDSNINTWLDVLFTHLVEPEFKGQLIAVYDYPSSQCALARLGKSECGRHTVAKRFEIFWDGIELANGYHELTDSVEQKRRFLSDNTLRKSMNMPEIPLDVNLLDALERGLPDCAGVALGVDRLLMCLEGENDIAKVMPFSFSR